MFNLSDINYALKLATDITLFWPTLLGNPAKTPIHTPQLRYLTNGSTILKLAVTSLKINR